MEYSDYKEGEVFGRLVTTGVSFFRRTGKNRVRMVQAKCECGVTGIYGLYNLRNGDTRSCGCLLVDELKNNPHAKTHGLTQHPLFDTWRGMKERCLYEKHNRFDRYGGRGIGIYEPWLKDFQLFYDWAIENGWEDGLTIERKNNDEDYGPDNCIFIPARKQAKNRSSNVLITAFGETKCIKDWSEDSRCQVTYWGLTNRLGRDKGIWPDIEKAITTPPGSRGETVKYKAENRMIFAYGEEKSMADWLKDPRCNVDEKVFKARLRSIKSKGMTIEEVISTKPRKSPNKSPVIESARNDDDEKVGS